MDEKTIETIVKQCAVVADENGQQEKQEDTKEGVFYFDSKEKTDDIKEPVQVQETEKPSSITDYVERDIMISEKDIKPGVSLAKVYSIGSIANKESFGGKKLVENMARVDKAITKLRKLDDIYNRNHSEWTRRMINMDHYDPWFNMRQISAELSSRQAALQEAKWRHVENQIKVEEMIQKLEENPNMEKFKKLKLQAKIARHQEGLETGMKYIEGAMKEVLILEDLFDQLTKQINDFNEEDYEKHNARAHIRQAISQSLRDVRMHGHITKGEQELLEQIGINPGRMQVILRDYVKQEAEKDEISVVDLKRFIDETSNKLVEMGVSDKKSELWGFNPKPRNDYMHLGKIKNDGLLTDQSDENKGG